MATEKIVIVPRDWGHGEGVGGMQKGSPRVLVGVLHLQVQRQPGLLSYVLLPLRELAKGIGISLDHSV